MKTKLHIFTLVIFITLFSCRQPNEKKNVAANTTDTLQTNKRENGHLKIGEQENTDSIKLDKVLQDALKIANQNFEKDKFKKKYEAIPDDNGYNIKVEISVDNHFTKNYSHLIIRRLGFGTTYIDIYLKDENRFEKIVTHKQWAMTYVNDTIRDINGDGLKDFVVNWYGATGCCLKAFSNVYLLRPDKKTFSKGFEFINPTFSPKEKIIRGVCYGHPSETEMYKYKWNGEHVDTLEYISYQKNKKGVKTGKILLSTDQPYGDKYNILKVLNSIPAEYQKIEGYDWFTGKVLD